MSAEAPAQPSAGLLRRFAAMLYDALLLMAISIGYGALALAFKVQILQQEVLAGQRADLGLPGFVGWVLVLVLFYCYFWTRSGQTLGMRAWRLELQGSDGGRPSLRACLLRCPLAVLGLALLGLGYFWRCLDPQQLTLHDRLSKTRVVLRPKE